MPVIAMTREMGSLGKDVAARLAERAGGAVIYHEIIDPLANKMRLRKSHVERLLDGKAGMWEKLTADKTSLSIYTADETFRALRSKGAIVIRGWGAAHLLRDVSHVIRARVCAPMDLRIQRMKERLGTDDEQFVRSEIDASEEAHTAITKRHFGVNWRDPELYDVVLSTERMAVDECVEELEGLMRRHRFQETPASIKIFDDLALQWHARAALRHDPRTEKLSITIAANDGRLTLSGMVANAGEASAAGEVVRAVPGVVDLENHLKGVDDAGSRFKREG